jgi:hypothetical protein
MTIEEVRDRGAAMANRNTSGQQHGRDRLSDLNGDLLGTILSFLPIKEAARAAALARPLRHGSHLRTL